MRTRYVPAATFVSTTSPSLLVDPCRDEGPSARTAASDSSGPDWFVTVRSIEPGFAAAVLAGAVPCVAGAVGLLSAGFGGGVDCVA